MYLQCNDTTDGQMTKNLQHTTTAFVIAIKRKINWSLQVTAPEGTMKIVKNILKATF